MTKAASKSRRVRPDDLEDFVHHLGRGMSFSNASAEVGFTRQALYARIKKDPVFKAQVEQARASVQDKTEAFLRNLRAGASISTAAPAAGLSRSEIYRWIGQDPLFSERVGEARSTPDAAVQRVLIKKAIEGDVRAMAIWLKCRRPGEWSKKAQ